ncbi:MAG: TonB-dependent receptor, partial [Bryobacterales bacterium]|nr:TonB-dependent receptor [Bryobacterales bacterium]
ALDLIYTQPGLVGDNFAGSRIGSLNITLDGLNVQDQRLNQGVSSPIVTTVDKIEEFRVVTSPADAELGRGSGQVQMLTRSGTNQFRGSLFAFHRNTALNANTWFNNQRGVDPLTGEAISPRNVLIRNQYGARIGGPVRRNKTFFFFLMDSQKIREKTAVTNTVYTETARRGVYRYYPGSQNGNANAAFPAVNDLGQPQRPSRATGDLQTINLFAYDPRRSAPDPTGTIRKMIDLMPLPNNFRSGDGLNTAGYTWSRPSAQNRDQYNFKADHHFNEYHRLSVAYVHENQANQNGFNEQPLPGSPGGQTEYRDRLWTLNLTSTLKPTLLNEFRAGVLRPWLRFYTAWEVGNAIDLLPKANGSPYLLDFTSISNPINIDDNPVGRISPLYQFADNMTWIRGKHAFKGGADVRFSSSNGFNSTDVMPRAVLATGGVPVTVLNTVPGIAQNLTGATNILNELTGTLSSMRQAFNSPGGTNPQWVPGEVKQRTWKRREYGFFFKDDWKVARRLTLNLGGRYDYYGVPYDANGKTAALVGGQAALFGISGTSFADMYQPGRLNGSLTNVEQVGPNTPNAGRAVHGQDRNNFAPAVGLSWMLPGFEKATVFRAGYMINYERNSLRVVDAVSGDAPGLRQVTTFTSQNYLGLVNATLPLPTVGKPLETVPLTDRQQIVRAFQDDLRNPYIQNWNATLQRELGGGWLAEMRYVGSKGTRLVRGTSVNEQNIFENGILDAFLVTQTGGNAPLFDRIFNGLNIPGVGLVNGTSLTGSEALRRINTTQANLAAHNVATLASFLSSTDSYTGTRGGLLRRAGLPENFVVVNPQFDSSRLTGNFANSTYHSFQAVISRRYRRGFGWQANYTWSKSLGEEEGAGEEMVDSYRSVRNWGLDKRRLSFHRTHVFRSSGNWEPRFGPRKGPVSYFARGWRLGAIFNVFSGAPLNVTSGRSSLNTLGDNTPTAVASISPGLGHAVRQGNGVVYFDGLQSIPDPSIRQITTSNGIQGRSTLRAIADGAGNPLLVNPTPGTLGNLQPFFLEGPGEFRFDVNVQRTFRLREGWELELRGDAIDVTNSPQWSGPNVDINSLNFGRITGAGGNRIIVLGARVNF